MALPVLLLVVLVHSAGDPSRLAAQDHDGDSLRLSVDVALVVLHATVTDREGGLITRLDQQDFEVYENGVRQRIRLFRNEDVPVTVGLVIDHSSTMRPKLAEVSAAARTFIRAGNRADELFVVDFNEKASLGLPRGIRFTDRTEALERAITILSAGGQPALYDAVAKGLEQLREANRDRKVLLVVSDGGDNASARSLTQVMKLAAKASVVIYTVGIFDEDDPDRNPGALRSLARSTGGTAFLPKQLSELVAVCERIAREIRHQYTIGYVPVNQARDGTYRAIRVVARSKAHDKLSVRTRTGYIAGAEPQHDNEDVK